MKIQYPIIPRTARQARGIYRNINPVSVYRSIALWKYGHRMERLKNVPYDVIGKDILGRKVTKGEADLIKYFDTSADPNKCERINEICQDLIQNDY